MKKILFLLAGSAFVASCSSNQSSSTTDSVKTDSSKVKTVETTSKPAAAATPATSWNYSQDTDKMTSKTVYVASIEATNKLNFNAPYDGGSTASLIIRNSAGTNNVLLQVDKGQFLCDITDGCAINIRFDDNPAIKFKGAEPSDGSSTVLFITPEKKFLTEAKKAKKMIVQAEFYQSGLRTMEFSAAGLKWEH